MCRAICLFVYEDNPEVRLQEYTDFWLSSSNVEIFDTAALSPSKSALSDAFLSDPLGLIYTSIHDTIHPILNNLEEFSMQSSPPNLSCVHLGLREFAKEDVATFTFDFEWNMPEISIRSAEMLWN